MSSDCEYEIDGDDFDVQNQEIVISNEGDDNEEEEEEEDDDEFDEDIEQQLRAQLQQRQQLQEQQQQQIQHNSDSSSGDDSSSSSSSGSGSGSSDEEEEEEEEDDEMVVQSQVQPLEAEDDDEESDEEIPSPPIEPIDDVKAELHDEDDEEGELMMDDEEEEEDYAQQQPKQSNIVKHEIDDDEEEEEESEVIPSSNVSMEADHDNQHQQSMMMMDDEEEEEEDDSQSPNPNEDEEVVITPDKLNEHGIYKWKEFVGACIRPYSAEQYKNMQIPFHQGWKRELVIRGSSTTEKKAGDVYYYPPDGTAKLRSYVELNGYLKRHPECGLAKENFTYAKQPVWRPPDEIVRAALQRGCNYVQRPMYFQQATQGVYKNPYRHIRGGARGGHTPGKGPGRGGSHSPNKNRLIKQDNDGHEQQQQRSESSRGGGHGPVGFGRGKRKRVWPSRYDEDNFALLPAVKKTKNSSGGLRDSLSNGNSQDSMSNPSVSSVSRNSGTSSAKLERRLNLQKQLLQQVHEDNMKRKALEEQKMLNMQQQQQGQQNAEQGQQSTTTNIKQEDSKMRSNSASPVPSLKIKLPKQQITSQLVQKGLSSKRSSSSLMPRQSINGHHHSQQQQHHSYSTELPSELMLADSSHGRSILDSSTIDAIEPMVGIVSASSSPSAAAASNTRQPCSAHCTGRRNMLPNLMCARCFCLFHLECVPEGVFLKEPTCFICPNCLTPEDKLKSSGVQSSTANNNKDLSKAMTNGSSSEFVDPMETFDSDIRSFGRSTLASHSQHGNIPSIKGASSSLLKNGNTNSGYPSFMNGPSMGGGKGGGKYGKRGGGAGASIVPGLGGGRKTLEMMLNGYGSAGSASAHAQFGGQSQQQLHSSKMQQMVPPMGRSNGGYGGSGKRGKHFQGPYGQYSSSSSMKVHQGSQSSSNSTLNFQPSINHVYRLANTSNGHQVVLKDKTVPYPTSNSRANGSYYPSSVNPGSLLSSKQQHSKPSAAQNYARSYYNAHHNGGHHGGGHGQGHGHGQQSMTSTPYSTRMLEDKLNAIMHMTGEQNNRVRQNSSQVVSKYAKYLQKHCSVLNSFTTSLSSLVKILDYLDTRDIISLRQTSRFWYQLTTITPIWTRLRFRGLPILDWSHLSSKIIGPNMVTLLDFEGVRIPSSGTKDGTTDSVTSSPSSTTNSSSTPTNQNKNSSRQEKICAFWRQFSLLHHHLGSVQLLKFGTVPLFVLQELVQHAADQPIDPFGSLKTLSVLNLFDDAKAATNPDAPVCLTDFFSSMVAFRSVHALRLDSKNGFVLQRLLVDSNAPKTREDRLQAIIDALMQFTNLEMFSLCSIKDLSSDEFAQVLSRLGHRKLTHLELGSCANWFDEAPRDPFEETAKCVNLTELKLIDLTVSAAAGSLVALFESLILVERLTLDNLKVEDSGFTCWIALTALFRSLPLSQLRFSTTSPFTNRAVFESIRDLVCTQKRFLHCTWVVTVNIDDQGHCFIPLSLSTFTSSPHSGVDFVKKYISALDGSNGGAASSVEDTYHIMEGDDGEAGLILVELSTLTDLLNRDINLNAFGANEPKVSVQIIPQ